MKRKLFSGFVFKETKNIAMISLLDGNDGRFIDAEFIQDLKEVVDYIQDSKHMKALLIKNISLKNSLDFNYPDLLKNAISAIHLFSAWEKLLFAIENLSIITMAQLGGVISGGGLHLAMTCDLKEALNETRFILSDAKSGILPGMLIYRLAKYMGIGNAKYIVLVSQEISLDTALKYGVVNKITDKHENIPSSIIQSSQTLR